MPPFRRREISVPFQAFLDFEPRSDFFSSYHIAAYRFLFRFQPSAQQPVR
jgi:hypothetical protein